MTTESNPLRQYFRRPAIYLKLPTGGQGYDPGVIDMPENGELPVYPMTAIDEIITKTPDALLNGDAISELIKSCIPNIKKPYEIKSDDLDAILIGIKTATQGNDFEMESQCPKCSEVSKYSVNLVSLLSNIKPADYDTLLEVNDLKFKFRPLIYKEMNEVNLSQFELQKYFSRIDEEDNPQLKIQKSKEALEKITDLTMKVLSKTIEFVASPEGIVSDTEYIYDYLKNCDKNTYIKIRDYNNELKNSSILRPLKVICPSCQHSYEQAIVINATDFFG